MWISSNKMERQVLFPGFAEESLKALGPGPAPAFELDAVELVS